MRATSETITETQEKPTASPKRRLTRDLLLIAGVLLAALLFFLIWQIGGKSQVGGYVEVRLGGEMFGRYSLRQDAVVQVSDGFILAIREGYAYVESSDCPKEICKHHQPIRKSGEVIVCLPKNITITVVGDGEEAPDFVQ